MGSSLDFACSPARRATYITGHISFYTRGMSSSPNSVHFLLTHPLQFVRKVGITHGDESRVGYYVGLMVRLCVNPDTSSHDVFQQSIFFATQALTVLHWSRLSDVVGRKPIILIGLFGLSLSMYSFGLSTTYWGAVLRHVHSTPWHSILSFSNVS